MIKTVDHIINIDLAKKMNMNQSISIKKNDTNSHKFIINIFNNSVAYDLTGSTSRIYFKKADGNKVFLDCILDSTTVNKLSVLLTTQTLTYAGLVASEITIYGTSGEILTSVTFNFTVSDNIRDDVAIESVSEFTALTDALAVVTTIANKADKTYVDANLNTVNSQLAHIPQETYITEKEKTVDVNNKLALKTDKTYSDGQLLLKRDKATKLKNTDMDTSTDANKIQPINVSDALMTMFSPAGTVSPVIPDGGVGTSHLANGATTAIKRTVRGNRGFIDLNYGVALPNIDSAGKTLTLTRTFTISWGSGRELFSLGTPIVIDISASFSSKSTYLLYNIKTYAFTIATPTTLNTISEDTVVIATFLIRSDGTSIDFSLPFTINGNVVINNLYYGGYIGEEDGINFDFINKFIYVKQDVAIYLKTGRKLMSASTIDITSITDRGVLFYDIATNTLKAWSYTNVIPNNTVIIALFTKTYQLVEGIDNYFVNGKSRKDIVNSLTPKETFTLTDNFQGYFASLERTYTNYNTTYLDIKHTDIYAMYDALETAYPNYVSHVVQDTINTNIGVLEIRKYNFKPVQTRDGVDNIPKIIIVAGQHGAEKMGQLATYNMFKDICENWKTDDRLRFLRHNIEFIVYPCLNAWGVDNHNRKNYNGVDINRNYPTNWVLNPDPSASTYGGTSALSEIETQCVQNTILANTDAIMFIDFHNFFVPVTTTDDIWISCPTEEAKLFGTNFIRGITSFWKSKYTDINQNDINFGYVDGGSYGSGTSASHADNNDVYAYTLEVGKTFVNQAGATEYGILSQKRQEEMVVNFILQNIKHLIM